MVFFLVMALFFKHCVLYFFYQNKESGFLVFLWM